MESIIKSIDHQSEIQLIVDGDITPSYPESYCLIFVLEGKIEVIVGSHKYNLNTGDIILISSEDTYKVHKQTKSNFIFIFKMSISLLMKSIRIEESNFYSVIVSRDETIYRTLKDSLNKIIKLMILQEDKANFIQLSYIFKLLNDITCNFFIYDKNKKKRSRDKEMIQYIHNHYYENISLQDMADRYYMEKSYFSRYFKKKIGMNFKEYIMNVRLSHALFDLRETEKNIATIAIDNGFANINSFNKIFKDSYHVTPSTYKNKYLLSKQATRVDYKEIVKRYEKYQRYNEDISLDNKQEINLTLNGEKEVLHPTWNVLINLGRAETILSDGMKQHIKIVQDELSYTYGRIWHVFSQSLAVDWDKGIIKNYYKLDEIFDYLVENDMYPWIELNKRALSTPISQLIELDNEKWINILTDFIVHMSNRYGMKNIRNWRFEMTINNQYDSEEQRKYIDFYNITRNILKQMHPALQLGGACLKIDTSIFEKAKILNPILQLDFDFYTFMSYPYYQDNIREQRNAQRSTEEDHLLNKVNRISQLLVNYTSKKVYITEWNNTVSNCNVISDTLYKGSYIIKNIIDVFDKIDGLGYWIISDVYHTDPKNNDILNGGSGLLNKHGMYKPAMIAMKFLNEFKNSLLINQGKNILVSKVDENEIMILCNNYQHPNSLYFYKKEDDITPREVESFFTQDKKEIDINLEVVKNGTYELRTYACNAKNGSVFDKWREFDFMKELNVSDITYLRKNNDVQLKIREEKIENHKMKIQIVLEAQEFIILNIKRKTKNNH